MEEPKKEHPLVTALKKRRKPTPLYLEPAAICLQILEAFEIKGGEITVNKLGTPNLGFLVLETPRPQKIEYHKKMAEFLLESCRANLINTSKQASRSLDFKSTERRKVLTISKQSIDVRLMFFLSGKNIKEIMVSVKETCNPGHTDRVTCQTCFLASCLRQPPQEDKKWLSKEPGNLQPKQTLEATTDPDFYTALRAKEVKIEAMWTNAIREFGKEVTDRRDYWDKAAVKTNRLVKLHKLCAEDFPQLKKTAEKIINFRLWTERGAIFFAEKGTAPEGFQAIKTAYDVMAFFYARVQKCSFIPPSKFLGILTGNDK